MGNSPSMSSNSLQTSDNKISQSDSLNLAISEKQIPKNHNSAKSFGLASLCPYIEKKQIGTSENTSTKVENNVDVSADSASKCPVKQKRDVYNVYGQKIDPTNNMPSTANQMRAPNQKIPLSTERVPSQIPKGGTDDETWVYPSPQMFWNALVRKNKVEGASEEYMDTVVAIHNNMNENTWKQILEWEDIYNAKLKDESKDSEPKLLKFTGRPDELSPKARIKMLFGHPPPFDRHDWIVDRRGKEVRYVIDYYHDETEVYNDEKPKGLTDTSSLKSIKVDVRPAIDGPEGLLSRIIFMPLRQLTGSTNYNPPSFFMSKQILHSESREISDMKDKLRQVHNNCQNEKQKLSTCKNEVECAALAITLQRCVGKVICPTLVKEFDYMLNHQESFNNDSLSNGYDKIQFCIEDFQVKFKKAFASLEKK